MRTDKRIPIKGSIEKECAFCSKPFYAKSDRAKYCSDSHKVLFSQMAKKSHQWYDKDPNEGKVLLPGTVTSWEMPEEKLVFIGNIKQLQSELSKYLFLKESIEESENIEKCKPFSVTGDWILSAVQIFTDENFMEVFRISPNLYKFYIWPWESRIEISSD
jgi:hypothetical protein